MKKIDVVNVEKQNFDYGNIYQIILHRSWASKIDLICKCQNKIIASAAHQRTAPASKASS